MNTKNTVDLKSVTPVAYSVAKWLPLTMNWIYTQIKYLDDFSPLVLTESTTNLELLPEFPLAEINGQIKRHYYSSLRKLGLPSIPAAFCSAVEKYNPKVLHSHFGDWGWYDLPLVRRYHLKHIVTFYGYDLSLLPVSKPKWKIRYNELFTEADQFLCEGPYMAQSLVDLGCPREKVRVYKLGVDLEAIPFNERIYEKGRDTRLLIAGRFVEKKGISVALEAIGRIKSKYPGLKVTVIGDSTGIPRDEVEKKKILDIIDHYQMGSIVNLLGFQPMDVLLREMYRNHIFLSPSVTASDGDSEGGAPVTIIQALASGMPVISTTHCDIPGVVTHGVSGLLSAERDVDSLVDNLHTLIDDPEKCHQMAGAGRRHIELEFDARKQGRKLKEIYDTFS